jgi:hypothetical protein
MHNNPVRDRAQIPVHLQLTSKGICMALDNEDKRIKTQDNSSWDECCNDQSDPVKRGCRNLAI